MPILRRSAPAGSYCGTCGTSACEHTAAAGSSTPGLTVTLRALLIGFLVALLVPLSLVVSVGTASAAPSDSVGHRSGYAGTGVVKYRGIGKDGCEGHALYVVNGARQNSAVRSMGPAGAGWVCVSLDQYRANPVGSVWTGMTGTAGSGPVG